MSKETEYQVWVNDTLKDTYNTQKDAENSAVFFTSDGDEVEIVKTVVAKRGLAIHPDPMIEWEK